MLERANTDLFNPLVPKAHNSECLLFPLQIKPVKVVRCSLYPNGKSVFQTSRSWVRIPARVWLDFLKHSLQRLFASSHQRDKDDSAASVYCASKQELAMLTKMAVF